VAWQEVKNELLEYRQIKSLAIARLFRFNEQLLKGLNHSVPFLDGQLNDV
jgi:hypothetical protein